MHGDTRVIGNSKVDPWVLVFQKQTIVSRNPALQESCFVFAMWYIVLNILILFSVPSLLLTGLLLVPKEYVNSKNDIFLRNCRSVPFEPFCWSGTQKKHSIGWRNPFSYTVNPRISPLGIYLFFWIFAWGLFELGGLFERGAYSRGL